MHYSMEAFLGLLDKIRIKDALVKEKAQLDDKQVKAQLASVAWKRRS